MQNRPLRSVLYVPASNAKALAKLPSLLMDAVIVDLEDAVHPDAKADARATLIAGLQETARFPGALEVIKLDGLRVEYADGFGLARPSNTTPIIVLRFEADNEAALRRIQAEFRKALLAVKPDAVLPF